LAECVKGHGKIVCTACPKDFSLDAELRVPLWSSRGEKPFWHILAAPGKHPGNPQFKGEQMKPIPDVTRRNVLRVFLAAAATGGTAFAISALAGPANAAPDEAPATPAAGQRPSGTGHRHLIGVL
jgi:hypothetical protein